MSIATGRDPQADALLQNTLLSLRIAIPGICYMESLSALKDEQASRNRFKNALDLQIERLKEKNLSLPSTKPLLSHLEQARIENQRLSNDLQESLFQALERLSKAETILLTDDILQQSLETPLIGGAPGDSLILYCILHHASQHPDVVRVFLTGNVNDFGTPDILEALRTVDISKYFTSIENFLGWFQSQSNL